MQKPIYKRWWFWVIILCVVGIVYNVVNGIPIFQPNSQSSTQISEQDDDKMPAIAGSNANEIEYYFEHNYNFEILPPYYMDDIRQYNGNNFDMNVSYEIWGAPSGEVMHLQVSDQSMQQIDLMVSAATFKYDRQSAEQAEAFIRDNYGTNATTIIGDAEFELYVGNNCYILYVSAIGFDEYVESLPDVPVN